MSSNTDLPETPSLDQIDYGDLRILQEFLDHLEHKDCGIYTENNPRHQVPVTQTAEEWYCELLELDVNEVQAERGRLLTALKQSGF